MDYQEKVAEATKLFEEVKTILSAKDNAEDRARVPVLMEAAKQAQADAAQLKDIVTFGQKLAAEKEAEQKSAAEQKRDTMPTQFKSFGEFLTAAWMAQNRRVHDSRLVWATEDEPKGVESKTMTGATGAGGGFLIPTEFLARLYAVIGENSIVQPRATVIPMRRRQVDIPVLDQTGTTSNIPHWFGGLRFYWTEEGGSKTESTAAFRQISLVARKLVGYTRATDELLADSAISLEAFLSGPLGFAGGVAWNRDYAFLRGTGAGQPLGVINAGATITVTPAAMDLSYTDLVNMLEHFLPTGRGVWVAHQTLLSDLMLLSGPSANPHYLWNPSAQNGVPGTLLGFPIIFTEKLPAARSAGSLLLADFSYYLVGDRQNTTVDSTIYDRFQYDETSWRVVDRCDGQPWLSSPLYLSNGTDDVSPFVILGAKST